MFAKKVFKIEFTSKYSPERISGLDNIRLEKKTILYLACRPEWIVSNIFLQMLTIKKIQSSKGI